MAQLTKDEAAWSGRSLSAEGGDSSRRVDSPASLRVPYLSDSRLYFLLKHLGPQRSVLQWKVLDTLPSYPYPLKTI